MSPEVRSPQSLMLCFVTLIAILKYADMFIARGARYIGTI